MGEGAHQPVRVRQGTGGVARLVQIRHDGPRALGRVEADGEARPAAARGIIRQHHGEAARGTQDVSANVARVLSSAGETGSAATQVLGAAGELATQSLRVKQDVDAFLRDIQAA